MQLNSSALAKAGSTDAFKPVAGVGMGKVGVQFFGNLNNETLTLQIYNPHTTAWEAYYCGATAQTYTNNSLLQPNLEVYELPNEFSYRYTMSNGAGTVSGVFVHVSGAKKA